MVSFSNIKQIRSQMAWNKHCRSTTPHYWNKCLRHYSIHTFYDLTFDLENLYSNAHSNGKYLCPVSFNPLHSVQRYNITQNTCQQM